MLPGAGLHTPAGSLAKHRMVVEHIFPDRHCLDRAKQYPRRLQIVRLHAHAHDLAHGRIAQQVIGNLDAISIATLAARSYRSVS